MGIYKVVKIWFIYFKIVCYMLVLEFDIIFFYIELSILFYYENVYIIFYSVW